MREEEIEQLMRYGQILQASETFKNIDLEKAWERVDRRTSLRSGWRKYQMIMRLGIAASVLIGLMVGFFYMRHIQKSTSFVVAEITPGSLKAVWKFANNKNYALSEAGERDIISPDGCKLGKDSVNTLIVRGGKVGERSVVEVPQGGEYRLVLSDGTKVWINSASELTFPMIFGEDARIVELKGEAYFDVAENVEKPFIVRTQYAQVRVLGTSFNVCSYEKDTLEQITLAQGNIEVCCDEEFFCLRPGEQFELNTAQQTKKVEAVDVQLYTSWVKGIFRFRNIPLDLLMVKLKRWYDVDFFFVDEVCKKKRFTGALRKDADFDKFIRLIERTTNVQFITDQKNITIKENKKAGSSTVQLPV